MLVGYVRVSTTDQDTRLQLDALKRAGVKVIYEDKISAVKHRPQLASAISSLARGDVLVVWRLDRVARSLRHLFTILEELSERGAGIRSLTEPINTATPAGRLMLQMLGAFAEFERSLIRERSIAGQVAAYQRGIRWGGRRPDLTQPQQQFALAMRQFGFTQDLIARHFGVSRSTISRLQNPTKKGAYAPLPVLREYLSGPGEPLGE